MGRFITSLLVVAIVVPAVAAAQIGEPGAGSASTPTTRPIPAPPPPTRSNPAPAPAPAAGTPSLQALQHRPLIVRGVYFAPQEQVSLALYGAGGALQRETTATADGQGSFTAGFGNESSSRCDTFLRAVGNRGNRAELKLLPGPACLPV